jgi:hypothetical protein
MEISSANFILLIYNLIDFFFNLISEAYLLRYFYLDLAATSITVSKKYQLIYHIFLILSNKC